MYYKLRNMQAIQHQNAISKETEQLYGYLGRQTPGYLAFYPEDYKKLLKNTNCLRCEHGYYHRECRQCNLSPSFAALLLFRIMYGIYTTYTAFGTGTNYMSYDDKLMLIKFRGQTDFKIANFKQEHYSKIYEILSIVPSPFKKTIIIYLKSQIENN